MDMTDYKEGGRPLRIILIGYMGAGKTTVGKALSKELGIPFYDLDWYIESRMRRTVKQIFDEKGEDGFRKTEQALLHEVAEFENVIISCGGGTPCFFDNMDYMNRQAETVYLKAAPGVLYVRCCSARHPMRSVSSSVNSWNGVNLFMRRQNIRST